MVNSRKRNSLLSFYYFQDFWFYIENQLWSFWFNLEGNKFTCLPIYYVLQHPIVGTKFLLSGWLYLPLLLITKQVRQKSSSSSIAVPNKCISKCCKRSVFYCNYSPSSEAVQKSTHSVFPFLESKYLKLNVTKSLSLYWDIRLVTCWQFCTCLIIKKQNYTLLSTISVPH